MIKMRINSILFLTFLKILEKDLKVMNKYSFMIFPKKRLEMIY